MASLEIFSEATISALRKKSIKLTGYLEQLLLTDLLDATLEEKPFVIITPSDPSERGAQLSLRLQPGLMDVVLSALQANSVIVDERKPDVIRVAPAPLYNTFTDVWEFCQIFLKACREAMQEKSAKV
jgi:kynureninase